jgi:hypothetical protein
MPRAKKKSSSSQGKPRIGRPPKTVATVAGLMSATPTALAVTASAAKKKKPTGRPPGAAGTSKPGGNQLPQGSNAFLATILELLRHKRGKLTPAAAEQILKILIAL